MQEIQWVAQYLAQHGPWALMAGGLVLLYRQDRQASEKRYDSLILELKASLEKNTSAMERLTEMITRHDEQGRGRVSGA